MLPHALLHRHEALPAASPGDWRAHADHTIEEVGQQFSVTRERIRQIEAKALRKLKHPSRARKMRSFLDQ